MRTKTPLSRVLALVLALTLLVTAFQAMAFAVTYTPTPFGDLDNDNQVNAVDALMVLQGAVGKITLTAEQNKRGELNLDGDINAIDALLILQYSVKIISKFPAQEKEELENLPPEEKYYAERAIEYNVDFSDFEEVITINDGDDATEIVEKLGGEPKSAEVYNYPVTEDGLLLFTPLSNEADRKNTLQKYKVSPKTKGKITLGSTVVEYSMPTDVTAYDMLPVDYAVYSTSTQTPIHIEANAFEDASRYDKANADYYDCNLPGTVAMDIEYLGYVNGTELEGVKPSVTPTGKGDVLGSAYPPYTTTDLVKSGTVKASDDYTWFKFSYKNTGNTIIDGEGSSCFRFEPVLYKKDGSGWSRWGGTYNDYATIMDYFYPGETGEFWALFSNDTTMSYALDPGEYRIVIEGCMTSEKGGFDYAGMQLIGSRITKSTFEFSVTDGGAMTTPNPVEDSNSGQGKRNSWLGAYEEFMLSYHSLTKVGNTAANATKGTVYVQTAPWTNQIVLKVMHGNADGIKTAKIPVKVETDSIKINLNTQNQNYIIKEDGTRTPAVYTQHMENMRSGFKQYGPNADETIINELLDMKEAGINTLTTTMVFTGLMNGHFDMSMFTLDVARKLGFKYENHCTYYYRESAAIDRVRSFDKKLDLGKGKDLFGGQQIDAANGVLARWNLNRYGDFMLYNPETKVLPISIEENYGWMTYNLNYRCGISNQQAARQYYKWLEEAYIEDIDALNKAYGTDYDDFNDIAIDEMVTSLGGLDQGATFNQGSGYGNWNRATKELDLFRTQARMDQYEEMIRYTELDTAKVVLRTENGFILSPGISPESTNPRYRQNYYEQYQGASVPEVLAASDAFYGQSSYCYWSFEPSEVYELVRQATQNGINIALTPGFNGQVDIVPNEKHGSYVCGENLNAGSLQKVCYVVRSTSAFTFNKAMYEAGGMPGCFWMDHACDIYATSTQYKEMKFFNQKLQEMLATKEGQAWANAVTDDMKSSPADGITLAGRSYPDEYIENSIAKTNRKSFLENLYY